MTEGVRSSLVFYFSVDKIVFKEKKEDVLAGSHIAL